MNDPWLLGLGFFLGWLLKSFFSWREIRRRELQQRAEVVSKRIYSYMRNRPENNCHHGLYIHPDLRKYVVPLVRLHSPDYDVDDNPGQLIVVARTRTWCFPYRDPKEERPW